MSPLKGDPLHNGIIQAVPGGLAPHVTCFLFHVLDYKALKALPSHLKFKQTFVFLLISFFGRQSLGTDTVSAVSKSRCIRRCVYNKEIKRLMLNKRFFKFYMCI